MLEINKELVMSTSHISPETQQFLMGENNPFSSDTHKAGMVIEATEHRWRILASNEQVENREMIPVDFKVLQKIAQDNDCKWLVLDCDGPVVPYLDVFDW